MALRIAGTGRPQMAPEPEQEELLPMGEEMMAEMPEEAPEMPMEEAPQPSGVVDPATAGYKGPEMGPFMCGNCEYFNGDGTCQLVAGQIDENGVCNLFTGMAPSEEEPMEESMMEEEPMEASEEMG